MTIKSPSVATAMFNTDTVNSSSRPACQSPPSFLWATERKPQSTSTPLVVSPDPDRITRLATSPSPHSLPFTTPFVTVTDQSAVASPRKNLKKPKRPLTAYHIYFQIEREFIIQTIAGGDADKSIHEGKTIFHDVPNRYRDTRLSPNWYFGPGKRAKRKHRKQHGKIGFLELSRVIASRWNKLEETDPDIKQFVSKLAEQEMDDYRRELKEYRENRTKKMITPIVVSKPKPQPKRGREMKNLQTSPRTSSSPLHGEHPCEDRSSVESPVQLCEKSDLIDLAALHELFEIDYANTYQQSSLMKKQPAPHEKQQQVATMMPHCQMMKSQSWPTYPEKFSFPFHGKQTVGGRSFLTNTVQLGQERVSLKNEFHYDRTYQQRSSMSGERRPQDDFVDICDDDILSLWKSLHA